MRVQGSRNILLEKQRWRKKPGRNSVFGELVNVEDAGNLTRRFSDACQSVLKSAVVKGEDENGQSWQYRADRKYYRAGRRAVLLQVPIRARSRRPREYLRACETRLPSASSSPGR